MLLFIGKPHLRSLKLLVQGKFLISNEPTTGVIHFEKFTNTFSRISFFEVKLSVFAESKRVGKSTRHFRPGFKQVPHLLPIPKWQNPKVKYFRAAGEAEG